MTQTHLLISRTPRPRKGLGVILVGEPSLVFWKAVRAQQHPPVETTEFAVIGRPGLEPGVNAVLRHRDPHPTFSTEPGLSQPTGQGSSFVWGQAGVLGEVVHPQFVLLKQLLRHHSETLHSRHC